MTLNVLVCIINQDECVRTHSLYKEHSKIASSEERSRLEALVGYYEMALGRGITITVENGKLHGEPTGSPKKELVLKSGTSYGLADGSSPLTVTFNIGADGKATALVMRQGNAEGILPKVR